MQRADSEALARRAVLQGDERAWEALYREHFAPVRAYVQRRLGGEDDLVDDVLQDTWMTAVRRIRRFDPDRGSFRSWLLGIATNACRSGLRRTGRRTAPLPSDLEIPHHHPPEVAARLPEALEDLDPRSRELLEARYAEGRSVRSLAADSDRTPKAVESALGRARRALRSLLGRPREDRGGRRS